MELAMESRRTTIAGSVKDPEFCSSLLPAALLCSLLELESQLAFMMLLSSQSFSLTKLWRVIVADTISILDMEW